MKRILVLLTCFHSLLSIAQEESTLKKTFELKESKGNFFFFWGYNRSVYAKSNIRLKGPDYDFTLYDVEAKDLPKKFSSIYYNPAKFTVPQFNFRIGFFISDKYAMATGWDHMKYRTVNGSKAQISGQIDASASVLYAGIYDNDDIIMNEDNLVRMEHSDGFNVINLNLERHDYLYAGSSENIALKLVSGVGIGFAVPWTNSFIFGVRNDDRPHFSGIGLQLFAAPEAVFFKRIFVRATAQGGFAKMWDIATTPRSDESGSHAEQTIWYLERSVVLGYRLKLFK